MAPVLDPTERLGEAQRAKPAGSSVRERTSSPSTSKPWKVETFVTLEEAARPHFSRFRQHRRASDAQPLAQGSSPNKSRMVGVFSTMRWKRNHVLIGIRRASTQEMFPRSSPSFLLIADWASQKVAESRARCGFGAISCTPNFLLPNCFTYSPLARHPRAGPF